MLPCELGSDLSGCWNARKTTTTSERGWNLYMGVATRRRASTEIEILYRIAQHWRRSYKSPFSVWELSGMESSPDMNYDERITALETEVQNLAFIVRACSTNASHVTGAALSLKAHPKPTDHPPNDPPAPVTAPNTEALLTAYRRKRAVDGGGDLIRRDGSVTTRRSLDPLKCGEADLEMSKKRRVYRCENEFYRKWDFEHKHPMVRCPQIATRQINGEWYCNVCAKAQEEVDAYSRVAEHFREQGREKQRQYERDKNGWADIHG